MFVVFVGVNVIVVEVDSPETTEMLDFAAEMAVSVTGVMVTVAYPEIEELAAHVAIIFAEPTPTAVTTPF